VGSALLGTPPVPPAWARCKQRLIERALGEGRLHQIMGRHKPAGLLTADVQGL